MHYLVQSQRDVVTSTAADPAYAAQFLHFTPKRRFAPILAELTTNMDEAAILYPEALGFERISQKRWVHRRIEELRRLKLVSRLVFSKARILLVFRPKKLWRPEVAVIFAIVTAAKILRPRKVQMVRRATSVRNLASGMLGRKLSLPDPLDAEETVFRTAVKGDGPEGMHLSLAWFRRAVGRLPAGDPLKPELLTLLSACDAFSRIAPVPFTESSAGNSTAFIIDSIEDSQIDVPLSAYMLHFHRMQKLENKFPLGQHAGRLAYLDWYIKQAPKQAGHALPLIRDVMAFHRKHEIIKAEIDTIASVIQTLGCDLTLPPYILALYRNAHGPAQRLSVARPAGRVAFAFSVVVSHARFQVARDFAGPGLAQFFASPVGGAIGNVSRLELMTAVLAHAPVTDLAMLETPWSANALRDWFRALSASGFPLLSTLVTDETTKDPALYITGEANIDTGLGRNQIMSAGALEGVQTNRDIFLHHVNADATPAQILKHNSPGAFHIGYLLWELETLPQAHMLADRMLDEIWVPSRFLQRVYQRAFDRPITNIGKGFDLPDVDPLSLSAYGITDSFIFLVCFDRHSSTARKNPLAAIQAFQKAFPFDPTKRLILKTTPAPQDHWGDPEAQMQAIRRIANRDPRIIIDERFLPFSGLLSLIKAVDCVVSAHRAEGFGYIPAYAQKLGTPVIATDYSGTTDFISTDTGFPVPFTLRKVRRGESILPTPGAKWAEIDQTVLADVMREVFLFPEEAARRARNATINMNGYYSAAALRQRYIDRFDTLGLTRCSPIVHTRADESKSRTTDRTGGMSPPAQP